jgi:hypothetical protein
VNNIRAAGGELLDLKVRGLLSFPALGNSYYINGVSLEDAEGRENDFIGSHAALINLPGFSITNPLYFSNPSGFRVYIKGKICFQVDETNAFEDPDKRPTGALYLTNYGNFNSFTSNPNWNGGSMGEDPSKDSGTCSMLSLNE